MPSPPSRLPEAFIARLQNIVPAEHWDAVLQSFAQSPRPCFRVNSLLVQDKQALLDALALPVQTIDGVDGVYCVDHPSREQLTHSAAAESGEIYIQDAASVLIANFLQAQAGEEVLDLAAAPGGKTLCLAEHMQNSGRIAAVEAVKSRFFQLQNNVQRAGATVVECFLKDGRKVGRQVPERFDRVLLDAPCSSESRFKLHDPSSFQFWSEKKIADMQRKQKQLLYSAIQACKPGGRIVYSTCSFAPEENEAVVNRQLQLWEERLEVVPIDITLENIQPGLLHWGKKSFDQRLQNAVRILPNNLMSGFFICVLKKVHCC